MNENKIPLHKRLNYGYIEYGFDPVSAQMDEATVYYIKLLTPGTVGFIAHPDLADVDVDSYPIDYENIELKQQFEGETLFSTALKNSYFKQTLGILKNLESYHLSRDFLYDILKLDDKEVVERLDSLMNYWQATDSKPSMTDVAIKDFGYKLKISKLLSDMLPKDFNEETKPEPTEQVKSQFALLLKGDRFDLAEKILEKYTHQYYSINKLARDLDLENPQTSNKLKEISARFSTPVFKRINSLLVDVLPAYEYKLYVLQSVDNETLRDRRLDEVFERKEKEAAKSGSNTNVRLTSNYTSPKTPQNNLPFWMIQKGGKGSQGT